MHASPIVYLPLCYTKFTDNHEEPWLTWGRKFGVLDLFYFFVFHVWDDKRPCKRENWIGSFIKYLQAENWFFLSFMQCSCGSKLSLSIKRTLESTSLSFYKPFPRDKLFFSFRFEVRYIQRLLYLKKCIRLTLDITKLRTPDIAKSQILREYFSFVFL